MNDPFLSILSGLFRECEQMFGSRDFSFLALSSLRKSLLNFQGSREDILQELQKMIEIIKNTSPRIALLMMMFFRVLEEFEHYSQKTPFVSLAQEKKELSRIISMIEEKRKRSVEKLLSFSHNVILDGSRVLIHDASHTIFDILLTAKNSGKNLQIVVAEQESEKTANIIRFLAKHHFFFLVIPEYFLSYVQENVDLCFVGAVTINSLHEVVSDPGTNSLVSQMRSWNIPVCVPITTDKFSLWDSENKHHSHKAVKRKSLGGIEYQKLIFSHDRYPLSWVTHFLTNKGVLSAEELGKMYDEYYAKNSTWREKNCII